MREVKSYMFELAWLMIVILLFAVAPVRTQDDAWNQDEAAGDCPPWAGWCPPQD